MSQGPEIIVLPDAASVAAEAAERIAASVRGAVAARGAAHWMTTGGSNPTDIYRRLASRPLRDDLPWERVHIWWTDDRFVPSDHPLSNVKPLDDALLNLAGAEEGTYLGGGGEPGVPIALDHLHPFRTAEAIAESRGAEWAAQM